MKLIWSDDYTLGINCIDLQHKALFDIICKFEFLTKGENITYDECIFLYSELKNYIHYHFRTEESMMKLILYDELELHKKEHSDFVTFLKTTNISKSNYKNEAKIIFEYIEKWIITHVMETDRKYTNQLKKYFDKQNNKNH